MKVNLEHEFGWFVGVHELLLEQQQIAELTNVSISDRHQVVDYDKLTQQKEVCVCFGGTYWDIEVTRP